MTTRNTALFMLLAGVLFVSFAGDALAQAAGGVNFAKADTVGKGFQTWLTGNLAKVVFAVAFAFAGFMFAFNKASWIWPLLIAVGAFFVFGGTNIVNNLAAAFK